MTRLEYLQKHGTIRDMPTPNCPKRVIKAPLKLPGLLQMMKATGARLKKEQK